MLYVLKFFTAWVFIMALFHKYVYKHVNILLLSFVTLIVGLYLSFINPRRFVFYMQGERFEYTGAEKFIIVDMFFHVFVFYVLLCLYGSYYRSKELFCHSGTWAAFAILALYVAITDIKKLYGISFTECICVFAVALVLYTILFSGIK